MEPTRIKAFVLAILDAWLPLLEKGDITPDELRAFVAASLTF